MTVNYSSPVNYNAQDYGVKKKTPVKQAVKGAAVGAVALGATSLGWQKIVLSDCLKDFKGKVIARSAQEMIQAKAGFYTRLLDNMLSIRTKGKLDWTRAGKAALIGGAIVGGLTAIVASCKQNKANKQMQAGQFGYYA